MLTDTQLTFIGVSEWIPRGGIGRTHRQVPSPDWRTSRRGCGESAPARSRCGSRSSIGPVGNERNRDTAWYSIIDTEWTAGRALAGAVEADVADQLVAPRRELRLRAGRDGAERAQVPGRLVRRRDHPWGLGRSRYRSVRLRRSSSQPPEDDSSAETTSTANDFRDGLPQPIHAS